MAEGICEPKGVWGSLRTERKGLGNSSRAARRPRQRRRGPIPEGLGVFFSAKATRRFLIGSTVGRSGVEVGKGGGREPMEGWRGSPLKRSAPLH